MRPLGYVDEVTRYSVSGWAGDMDQPSMPVTVVIRLNDKIHAQIVTHLRREGLEEVGLADSGPYGFRLYFETPLTPFQTHTLSASIEGTGHMLDPGEQPIHGVVEWTTSAGLRPDNAILVSTMGRSGSTLLMGLLSRHPRIVVGDWPPFEIEMLTYYAYLFRALVAPGDHERSLRPDAITHVDQRFRIGFNPFLETSFRANFNDPANFDGFITTALPQTMGRAIHNVVLDFYAAVAKDRRKDRVLYFAEKALPEMEIRESTRYLFPRAREIMLVRDLRDVLVSFIKHGMTSFKDAVDFITSSSSIILHARRQPDQTTLFVRYEDLVERPAETAGGIFRYLDLPDHDVSQAELASMFQGHGTAESPVASIGRWRTELSPDQRRQCAAFDAFHMTFGYSTIDAAASPAPPPSTLPSTQPSPALLPVVSLLVSTPAVTVEVPSDAKLVLAFESLGENCEFGLVQRRCGGEPLGLLRFASSPYPVLMRALQDRFADMGRRDLLQVRVSDNGREYMVHDQKFGFLSHAWVLVGEKTADEVHQRECRRVPFLVRKLVEDLSGGEKIMVYHAMQPLTQVEAEALAAAIAGFGARTTLLWVELAETGHPPGSVVRLGPYLLKGHMDRFAPGENAHDLSLESWLAICRAAYALSPP